MDERIAFIDGVPLCPNLMPYDTSSTACLSC